VPFCASSVTTIGPIALLTSLEPDADPRGGDSCVLSTCGVKVDREAAVVYQTTSIVA
jgi:hypothetical protein